MMKLVELFKTPQLTSLLSTNSHTLVLGCLDPRTGAVTRVAISADMVALPDEALLFVQVTPEGVNLAPPDFSNDYVKFDCVQCSHSGMTDADGICWFPMQVEYDDEPEPCNCRCAINLDDYEAEPLPTWAITPQGVEVDLRDQQTGYSNQQPRTR